MSNMCTWVLLMICVFFFNKKTAYDRRISDWSLDVCSSDLDYRYRKPEIGAAARDIDPHRLRADQRVAAALIGIELEIDGRVGAEARQAGRAHRCIEADQARSRRLDGARRQPRRFDHRGFGGG